MPASRCRCLVALLVLVLAACSDDPTNPRPGPDVEELPVAERLAALDAVTAELDDLLAQELEPAALNAALAAYLETLPEFDTVGVDEEQSTVWAIFTDGRGLIIPNNLVLGDTAAEPAPAPSRAHARETTDRVGAAALPPRAVRAAADPPELPTSRNARLLSTFRAGFAFEDGAARTRAQLEVMLDSAGWDATSAGAAASTVAALRAVSGDGFFYINTHGGPGYLFDGVTRQPTPTFGLQTSTVVTATTEADSAIVADLRDGLLVYIVGDQAGDGTVGVSDKRYAFTAGFVQKYMGFSDNALVFLNACGSTYSHTAVTAMLNAFRARGANVVIGWTDLVNANDAWRAALYLVDRMTGANDYKPEPSRHRPFPLQPVLDWMDARNLDESNGGSARMTLVGATSGAGFGLLAPTIQRMHIDSSNIATPAGALMIYGDFGTDPGAANRRVFVRDGSTEVNLTVWSWTPDSIKAIPLADESQPGFAGDVIVESRGRRSNPRRLHAWYGTATYMMDGPGSLEVRLEMDIAARFDPDSIRHEPGQAAVANTRVHVFRAFPTPYPELEARWLASGSSPWPDCGTMTWSGSGSMLTSAVSANESYLFTAALKPQQRDFELRVFQAQDFVGYTTACGGDEVSSPVTFSAQMFLQQGTSDINLHVPVDTEWNVVGKSFQLAGDGMVLTLDIPAMSAMPAYDPRQPR